MPGPKTYSITLRGISDLLAGPNFGELDKQERALLRSAINTFSRAVGRDPSEIIADPNHINHLLKDAGWQRLEISKNYWSTVVSRLRSALRLAGVSVEKRRNFKLDPEWESLLGPPLPGKKRENLSRFGGWCTVLKIKPHEVTADTFERFLRYNHEQVVQRDPRERWQESRRAWNVLSTLRSDLSLLMMPNTTPPRWRGLTIEQLPSQLQEDLELFKRALVSRDPLDGSADEPLRPVTISNYLNDLRRFVSRLVETGVPLGHLTSLKAVLSVEHLKTCFKHQVQQMGKSSKEIMAEGHPTLHAQHAALVAAAKFVGATDDQWAYLRQIGKFVRPRQMEMTAKNLALLEILSDPKTELKYLRLPLVIADRYLKCQDPTRLEAQEMQSAVAFELLIKTALRIENLANLDLQRHLRRPAGAMAGHWQVHIDAHETKGAKPMDIKLFPVTSALLDRYVNVFRPAMLQGGACSALFPTMSGQRKTKAGLAKQLKKFVKRELGIPWHPHIVRSHAGSMVLEEDPNSHRLVQQLLQHSSIDTTTRHYLPQRRAQSHEAYDKIIEQRRQVVHSSHDSKSRASK